MIEELRHVFYFILEEGIKLGGLPSLEFIRSLLPDIARFLDLGVVSIPNPRR
jgi:hypothetical protein